MAHFPVAHFQKQNWVPSICILMYWAWRKPREAGTLPACLPARGDVGGSSWTQGISGATIAFCWSPSVLTATSLGPQSTPSLMSPSCIAVSLCHPVILISQLPRAVAGSFLGLILAIRSRCYCFLNKFSRSSCGMCTKAECCQ